jgi:hypothetical protein
VWHRGDHLRRAIEGHRLGHVEHMDEKLPEWKLLKSPLLEALDPFIRRRLETANASTSWAMPWSLWRNHLHHFSACG